MTGGGKKRAPFPLLLHKEAYVPRTSMGPPAAASSVFWQFTWFGPKWRTQKSGGSGSSSSNSSGGDDSLPCSCCKERYCVVDFSDPLLLLGSTRSHAVLQYSTFPNSNSVRATSRHSKERTTVLAMYCTDSTQGREVKVKGGITLGRHGVSKTHDSFQKLLSTKDKSR